MDLSTVFLKILHGCYDIYYSFGIGRGGKIINAPGIQQKAARIPMRSSIHSLKHGIADCFCGNPAEQLFSGKKRFYFRTALSSSRS